MSIVYKCRHCGHVVGKLDQQVIDSTMLGFDQLSVEDRKEMIEYQNNGDVHITVICENCEESLGHNPHYHELDFFIQ
ncbi:anti-sigma-F factor Fin [Virgibacillus byunsanensis]|uniref:Anti-sigma-F factor Fin n=1 Tax=Virgibacillus byunsanensis TaxID=570945 RepID=A0ABW3LSP1_9BACI